MQYGRYEHKSNQCSTSKNYNIYKDFYICVSVHHKSIIYFGHGTVQCPPTLTSIQDLFQPHS